MGPDPNESLMVPQMSDATAISADKLVYHQQQSQQQQQAIMPPPPPPPQQQQQHPGHGNQWYGQVHTHQVRPSHLQGVMSKRPLTKSPNDN